MLCTAKYYCIVYTRFADANRRRSIPQGAIVENRAQKALEALR